MKKRMTALLICVLLLIGVLPMSGCDSLTNMERFSMAGQSLISYFTDITDDGLKLPEIKDGAELSFSASLSLPSLLGSTPQQLSGTAAFQKSTMTGNLETVIPLPNSTLTASLFWDRSNLYMSMTGFDSVLSIPLNESAENAESAAERIQLWRAAADAFRAEITKERIQKTTETRPVNGADKNVTVLTLTLEKESLDRIFAAVKSAVSDREFRTEDDWTSLSSSLSRMTVAFCTLSDKTVRTEVSVFDADDRAALRLTLDTTEGDRKEWTMQLDSETAGAFTLTGSGSCESTNTGKSVKARWDATIPDEENGDVTLTLRFSDDIALNTTDVVHDMNLELSISSDETVLWSCILPMYITKAVHSDCITASISSNFDLNNENLHGLFDLRYELNCNANPTIEMPQTTPEHTITPEDIESQSDRFSTMIQEILEANPDLMDAIMKLNTGTQNFLLTGNESGIEWNFFHDGTGVFLTPLVTCTDDKGTVYTETDQGPVLLFKYDPSGYMQVVEFNGSQCTCFTAGDSIILVDLNSGKEYHLTNSVLLEQHSFEYQLSDGFVFIQTESDPEPIVYSLEISDDTAYLNGDAYSYLPY